jgi:enoyl-CoA hydratase/carnithine racemase
MGDKVLYSVAGGIATLLLRDPPANTYSYEMMQELDAAILRARMDDDVHVLVLRGDGEKFFCAGADIKMLASATPSFKYNFCLHANETLNRLEQTPKLVIAAINGHCVGGGLEVAMACDLRLAKKGVMIGLPEINLGVLPGTGGTQRLARLVGKARALELMVDGANLTAEAALAERIVSRVVEPDGFEREVRELAERFAPPKKAAKAVGAIKRAVVSGAEMSFGDGLALERELQQQLFISDDAKEGIGAYVAKRKAEFKGR